MSIKSGDDTTLKGAVVTAREVSADVGGNLKIESLQDQAVYTDKQSSSGAGVSLCIPPICVGQMAVVNVSVAKAKIDSDYLSVGEQSAIRAGDGGFQVKVGGDTTLTGAQITSTQAAIDDGKNSFSTGGTLTTQDLQNRAEYEATSYSVSISTAGGGAGGYGSDSGSASSTSTAGISGIAGDTGARTGDAETGIKPIFDAAKVKQEVQLATAVTSEFGRNASKAVGDYATTKLKEAKENNDQEGIDAWKEGGSARVALHAVVGGLSLGVQGALGATAASAAAPLIDELQTSLQEELVKAGLGQEAAKAIAGLTGAGTAAVIGGAAGGTAGATTAFNADVNNRQLHPSEQQKAKELAAKSGGKYTQEQIEEQMRLMGNAATGDGPNELEVLVGTEAIVNNLTNDPGMPKVVHNSVIVEVLGQPNRELQSWIIGNTKEGAGYIPGQSPYIASNPAISTPTTTNVGPELQTARCGNMNLPCKSGAGVQQNAPLTDQARNAIADAAASVSRGSGVVAAGATTVAIQSGPYGKAAESVAIGAALVGAGAGAVEQLARPDMGQSVNDSLSNYFQDLADKKMPGVAPATNELFELWKQSGTSESLQNWVNTKWKEFQDRSKK